MNRVVISHSTKINQEKKVRSGIDGDGRKDAPPQKNLRRKFIVRNDDEWDRMGWDGMR